MHTQRLIKMVDPATGRPLFTTRCIELVCEDCKENGKAHECVHMLHLVPSWQSAERHRKLRIMVRRGPVLVLWLLRVRRGRVRWGEGAPSTRSGGVPAPARCGRSRCF